MDRLEHHQADRDAVGVLRAEILALLYGTLQVFSKARQCGNELCPGRGQRRTLAAAFKYGKACFILHQFDLVGEGGLADEHVLRRPAEIERVGEFDKAKEWKDTAAETFYGKNGAGLSFFGMSEDTFKSDNTAKSARAWMTGLRICA